MATINQDIMLKHRPNLGEETEEIEFKAGSKFTILNEWKHHYFCKDADERVFNIRKKFIDAND